MGKSHASQYANFGSLPFKRYQEHFTKEKMIENCLKIYLNYYEQ